jgi:hypothetical protein
MRMLGAPVNRHALLQSDDNGAHRAAHTDDLSRKMSGDATFQGQEGRAPRHMCPWERLDGVKRDPYRGRQRDLGFRGFPYRGRQRNFPQPFSLGVVPQHGRTV